MMKMKKASEIFGEVDSNLRVIDRRTGRRGKGKDWKRTGGALCPRCNLEAVRFIRGVCIPCAQALNQQLDKDEKKAARIIKFIKQHNARIARRKR